MSEATDEQVLDDLVAVVPPLLQGLEVLGFVSRYLNPPDLRRIVDSVGQPETPIAEALPRLEVWPERLAGLRERLQDVAGAVLGAFMGLREAAAQPDGMRGVYRAMGLIPRAQEALYPLAGDLPPVNRFFMSQQHRGDVARMQRLAQAGTPDNAGVFHGGGEPGARGAFSGYVPEDYTPERAWPLVMALHGGAGNGRSFLWSWLRDARACEAIVIAPTAIGQTWALQGPDPDTPNLAAILDFARSTWNIDPGRLLLTGMSDGGTFSYVSGLEPSSPFTHLAPVSAAFHPMLAQMADPQRMQGLPIFTIHGALDWMFPIEMAREATAALAAAGANAHYLEIDDLSHTYPREVNPGILAWLNGETPA
jgi:phospholipase/carboxylesterase